MVPVKKMPVVITVTVKSKKNGAQSMVLLLFLAGVSTMAILIIISAGLETTSCSGLRCYNFYYQKRACQRTIWFLFGGRASP